MNRQVVFLLGTGALAKAIVDTLSFSSLQGIQFHVYSRSIAASTWLATIGNTRSRVRGNAQQFIPKQIDWSDGAFLDNELATHQPLLVIHTASLQSMWTLSADNKWTRLVKETGYGTTLPLQCKLALAVASSVGRAGTATQLINCCYPDAVNFVLKQCGLQVLCGIGNIGIIEQLLLNQGLAGGWLMLANHFHVQELTMPAGQRTELPKLWVNGEETNEPFDKIHLSNEPSLNSITALTCLNLLTVLVNRNDAVLHLPGPLGEIGGYPVHFRNGAIERIGTTLMEHEAEKRWNSRLMEKEGLIFDEDCVRFSGQTAEKIGAHSKALARGFAFSGIDAYIDEFIALRERLSSS